MDTANLYFTFNSLDYSGIRTHITFDEFDLSEYKKYSVKLRSDNVIELTLSKSNNEETLKVLHGTNKGRKYHKINFSQITQFKRCFKAARFYETPCTIKTTPTGRTIIEIPMPEGVEEHLGPTPTISRVNTKPSSRPTVFSPSAISMTNQRSSNSEILNVISKMLEDGVLCSITYRDYFGNNTITIEELESKSFV